MNMSRPPCPVACPSQSDLDLFIRSGVQPLVLASPEPVMVARGAIAADGLFDVDASGERWFAIEAPEAHDGVFWHFPTGRLASWSGRIFALGETIISRPSTYSFDCVLNIFDNPMDWLRARRDGIVVLPGQWPLAFDRLRDCPRIAVVEALVPTYRRWMRPARLPELSVLCAQRRAA